VFKSKAGDSLSRRSSRGEAKTVTVEKATPGATKIERFPDSFQQNAPGCTIPCVLWMASLLAAPTLKAIGLITP
jgi:hypothetical protein